MSVNLFAGDEIVGLICRWMQITWMAGKENFNLRRSLGKRKLTWGVGFGIHQCGWELNLKREALLLIVFIGDLRGAGFLFVRESPLKRKKNDGCFGLFSSWKFRQDEG